MQVGLEVAAHVPHADLQPVQAALVEIYLVPKELPELAVVLGQMPFSSWSCQWGEWRGWLDQEGLEKALGVLQRHTPGLIG